MTIIFANEEYEIENICQFENIRYSKSMSCECGHSYYGSESKLNIIGFCDTSLGYMVIFECDKCFETYRHHINTYGRYDLEQFKQDLGLLLYLRT